MNKTNPLVSVVITTYNRPEKVKRAIQSVQNQTYKPLEVILVEDGSQSGIEEWLINQGLEQITYINHDSNCGLAAARNTGIKQTSGDYIAFLDDDDEWKSRRIEAQVDRLKEERHLSDLGVVYCAVERRTPEGEIISYNEPENRGKLSKAIKQVGASTLSSTFLFRREALETVGGFDELLPSSIDHDMWMKLAVNDYRAIAIDEPLVINYSSPDEDMVTNTTPRIYGVQRYVEKWRPTYREWFGSKEGDTYADQYFADVIGRLAAAKVNSRSLFEAGQAICAMFGYCENWKYVSQVLVWRIIVLGIYQRLPDSVAGIVKTLFYKAKKYIKAL